MRRSGDFTSHRMRSGRCDSAHTEKNLFSLFGKSRLTAASFTTRCWCLINNKESLLTVTGEWNIYICSVDHYRIWSDFIRPLSIYSNICSKRFHDWLCNSWQTWQYHHLGGCSFHFVEKGADRRHATKQFLFKIPTFWLWNTKKKKQERKLLLSIVVVSHNCFSF